MNTDMNVGTFDECQSSYRYKISVAGEKPTQVEEDKVSQNVLCIKILVCLPTLPELYTDVGFVPIADVVLEVLIQLIILETG